MDLVVSADLRLGPSPSGHSGTGPRHTAVEVHAIDTDRRVVLDAQVNVFRDTEAKVARVAEVFAAEFVFLDFQATLEDLFSLGASDGDVNGNLFVTTDTKGSDGVAGLACRNGSVLVQHSSVRRSQRRDDYGFEQQEKDVLDIL